MMRTITLEAETDPRPHGDGLDTIVRLAHATPTKDAVPVACHNYLRAEPGTYVHVDDVTGYLRDKATEILDVIASSGAVDANGGEEAIIRVLGIAADYIDEVTTT